MLGLYQARTGGFDGSLLPFTFFRLEWLPEWKVRFPIPMTETGERNYDKFGSPSSSSMARCLDDRRVWPLLEIGLKWATSSSILRLRRSCCFCWSLSSGLLLARWLAWLIDWPDWEDWDRWLLPLFWFAWNVFNRLGTGLDRPDFQLDMGVKQSQSNNHGTRLAYGRLCRQPMWPYPEKVVGPARLCRGCHAWLKGNPCLKKKWSSNSTW